MKVFLRKLSFFTLVPILCLIFCEIEMRKIPNNYSYKKNYITNNGGKIETLVLGSSHAQCAINPEYFPHNSFSLASSGQTLYLDNLLLDRYSANLNNLKNIIISISYFSLSTIPNTGAEALIKYDFLRYHDLGNELIDRFDFKKYLITYNKGLVLTAKSIINYKIYNKDNITGNKYGADISNNDIQDLAYLKKDAIKASKQHENNSLDFSENIKYLTEIINYAKNEKINVFFVITPFTDFYFNELNPIKVKKINYTLDSLAKANNNVEALNYAQDKRFVYQYFKNSDHLNLPGQEKFSKILVSDIQKFIKINN